MKMDELVGNWTLSRKVYHPFTRVEKGMMEGNASFDRLDENELLYKERVEHITANKAYFTAFKSYRYRFEEDFFHIFFDQEEGDRLFMTLPYPKRAPLDTPLLSTKIVGEAVCQKDYYTLAWEWMTPNNFITHYKVSGTQKNYIIESEFKK